MFNPIIVGKIVESTKKNRFKFTYFIENENKRIAIPNFEDAFIDFIVANLSDRSDIVVKVKNKEYQYSDIEKIFRDYNKK